MKLAELKKLMPDASKEVLAATLEAINNDAAALVASEVEGLKTNQTKNLDQIKKLKGTQAPEGYDPEGYKTFIKEKGELATKQKELDDAALEGKGQWDALKLGLNQTHETAIATLTTEKDTQIGGLTKALNKVLIDNASLGAIGAEEGNALFLTPHMKNKMETYVDDHGDYGVRVIDAEGQPRLQDDATTPFTVADLVAEMKADEKFAPAFPQQNGGGGGNPNAGGSGGGGVNPWKADTKNITAQAEMNKNNPTLAVQMKKAAGVAV